MPLAAFRASGYWEKVGKERGDCASTGGLGRDRFTRIDRIRRIEERWGGSATPAPRTKGQHPTAGAEELQRPAIPAAASAPCGPLAKRAHGTVPGTSGRHCPPASISGGP